MRAAGSPLPVAISMGDPAGIGPEVILKALRVPAVRHAVQPILVGTADVFASMARRYHWSFAWQPFVPGKPMEPGRTYVWDPGLPHRIPPPGLPRHASARARCGEASYRALLAAVDLVQRGDAAALVTAPIAKAHWALAGYDLPGHTELLARLAGGVPVRMMMAGPRLRVVLMTTHVPLVTVPAQLSVELVQETIVMTATALSREFGIAHPRLAVAGINPHAGEHGLFGQEDDRLLRPAIARARRRGIDVHGPVPADTVFVHAASGAYAAVVCPYHDQALAPFKLLHFHDGVNVTIGLPFVRTSPDHGTAFDIAGQNRADPRSMTAALLLAAQLARHRAAGQR